MSTLDTGIALAQLLDIIPVDWTKRDKDVEVWAKEVAVFFGQRGVQDTPLSKEKGGAGNRGGIRELSREIGMSQSSIQLAPMHLKPCTNSPMPPAPTGLKNRVPKSKVAPNFPSNFSLFLTKTKILWG